MSRQFLQVEIRDRDREILSVVQSNNEGRGRSREKLSVVQSVDDGREPGAVAESEAEAEAEAARARNRQKKLKSAKVLPRTSGSEKSKQIK